MPGRWWHSLFAAALVLLSLPVFATLILALRLQAGPIDVTESARRLAHGMLPGLTFKRMRLSWNGWAEGPSAPLGLIASGVRFDHPGVGRARARDLFVAFDLPALLRGHVAVQALRADDGGIEPEPGRQPSAAGNQLDLRELSEIGLSRMTLAARVGGRPCQARVDDLRFVPIHRPAAIGVTGRVQGALSCGAAAVSLRGVAREGPGGAIVWHVATGNFVPAQLGLGLPPLPGVTPAGATLAGLALPVALQLDATLSGGLGWLMLPRRLDLTARLGAGVASGVPIRSGLLHLTLDLPNTRGGALRAALLPSRLDLGGDTGSGAVELRLSGSLSRTGNTINGRVASQIARFDFARLDRIWPAALAPATRQWVSTNIVKGIGHDGSATAELASADGWRGLRLVGLKGGLYGDGLTLFWLRPVPPLTQVDAHLVLEGPDSLRIEGRHAVVAVPSHGVVSMGPTMVRITGLSGDKQLGHVDTMLSGAVPDVLALLAQPRLHLLSDHPLPFTDVSGAATAHLVVSLPLLASISINDMSIKADATLRHLHLGHAVVGRALDAATLAISAGNSGLRLHGQCAIGGVPADLSYAMDFQGSGASQVTETAHVLARIDPAAVRREGLDDALGMRGTAQLAVDYARRRSGAGRVALALDLTDAGLRTLVWRKQPGTLADVSAVIGLRGSQLATIDSVSASGDGLALEGYAKIDRGALDAIVISHFAIGRSRGEGRVDLPGSWTPDPLTVTLRGQSLDVAPYADMRDAGLRAGAASGGAPGKAIGKTTGTSWLAGGWRLDLGFDRVLFAGGHTLAGVRLQAESRRGRISAASLAVAAPAPIQASLWTQGAERRLRGRTTDMGALLAGFGVSRRIEGGTLALEAGMRDGEHGMRLTGAATTGRFIVHDAPLAARLARDFSVYGLLFGAPGRQLVISRLNVPFTWQEGALRLIAARASNAALGVTLRGLIDLRRDKLDLHGTIVPSYILNALPGKLPGVGRVFSPEHGGGLLAATLRVTGSVEKPAISVNPLSLLVPGILRRLLFN